MVKLLCSNIILGSDRPIRLHGGLVLGVAFDKKIRSGESSQDGSGSRQRLSCAPCAQPGGFTCLGPGIEGASGGKIPSGKRSGVQGVDSLSDTCCLPGSRQNGLASTRTLLCRLAPEFWTH